METAMSTLINDTMDKTIQLKIRLTNNKGKNISTKVVVCPHDKRSERSAEDVHVFCMTDSMGELKSLLLGKFGNKLGRKDIRFSMPSGTTSKREAIADVEATSPLSAFLDGLPEMIMLHADVVDSRTKRVQTSNTDLPKQQQTTAKKAKCNAAAQKRKPISSIDGIGKRICDSRVVGSEKSEEENNQSNLSVDTVRASAGLNGWFKTAQLSSEQTNLARARVNAVMEGNYSYSITEIKGDSEKTIGGAREGRWTLKINFTRGLVENTRTRRGEETIELIPDGRIKEFLLLAESGLGKLDESEDDKVLSPLSISRACPRLFWTMVNKFIKDCKEKPKSMDDVLRHILPGRDWGHLERLGRIRSDSAKARENKRQQNGDAFNAECKVSCKPTVSQDVLESSMYLFWRGELRASKKASKLHLRKKASKQSIETTDLYRDNWQLEVPKERDEEKIRDCIKESVHDETLVHVYSSVVLEEDLLNWRQLADADSRALWQKVVFKCKEQNKSCPEFDVVDRWIVKAQEEICDEILTEIFIPVEDIKGREKSKVAQEIFQLLKKTNTDTPMDFVGVWAHLPPDQMLLHLGCSPLYFKESDARRWVSRAKQAIERHPWLKDFYNLIDSVGRT